MALMSIWLFHAHQLGHGSRAGAKRSLRPHQR